MKTFDFSTKTLIDSFTYTTITNNREAATEVVIDGRNYTKWGTLQAVTIVGNLYEDNDGNRIMLCGIARQHPNDTRCNKQVAYEVAQLRALSDPDLVINTVPKYINNFNFSRMMSWYVDGMNLEFIKTKEEIKKIGDNPQKYNR